MVLCAVFGCNNKYGRESKDGIVFYKFPPDKILASEWVNKCGRKEVINTATAVICSKHFIFNDFMKPDDSSSQNTHILKPNVVPTQHLPQRTFDIKSMDETATKCARELIKKRIEAFTVQMSKLKCNEADDRGKPTDGEESEDKTLASDLETVSNEVFGLIKVYNELKTKRSIMETRYEELTSKLETLAIKHYKMNTSIAALTVERNKYLKENERLLKRQRRNADRLQNQAEKPEQTANETNFLTQSQLKQLCSSKKKRLKWTSQDIALAIFLRSVNSSNLYEYPALSTLKEWAKDLVQTGLLDDVLTLMKVKGNTLEKREKLVVLTFGEIPISNKVCLDQEIERVYGPFNTCQVVMAQGLYATWNQPVFYDFNTKVTKELLLQIIEKLAECGYTVVAVTCNMTKENWRLWKKFGIDFDLRENCYITHPTEKKKIFFFADIPNLLMLFRELLDIGVVIDGEKYDKKCFERLLELKAGGTVLTNDLNVTHLSSKGSTRQKTKLAVELFSTNTVNDINMCKTLGLMKDCNASATAKMVKLVNDWFNIFNAYENKRAFGILLQLQKSILDRMSVSVTKMDVRHDILLPFKAAILISNKSLVELHAYLKQEYEETRIFKTKFLLTGRLNQGALENFFSYIRKGCSLGQVTSLDVKSQLRFYIFGKPSLLSSPECSDEIGDASMVSSDDDTDIQEYQCLINPVLEYLSDDLSQHSISEQELEFPELSFEAPGLDSVNGIISFHRRGFQLKEEGLNHIAAFTAYKFSNKYPELSTRKQYSLPFEECPEWLYKLSKGLLLQPTESLVEVTQILEKVFNEFHGEALSKESFIFKKVTALLQRVIPTNLKLWSEVLVFLVKIRTFIRLNAVNKRINDVNTSTKITGM